MSLATTANNICITASLSEKPSSTLADRVLAQIQSSIIKGELAAGSKINEQALAEKYGISRGPTREALHTLERRRLVVRVPHIGAHVAELSISELNDLYQLRSVLESMACELATKHITDEQIIKLQKLLQHQEAVLASGEHDFQEEGDVDFHYQIIRACKNRHLQETLIGGLYHLLRMYRYQCTSERRPLKAIEEHKRILEAIVQKDGELAGLLMRRHIEQGRVNIESRLKALQAKQN